MVLLSRVPHVEDDRRLRIERLDPLRSKPGGEVESDLPGPLPQRDLRLPPQPFEPAHVQQLPRRPIRLAGVVDDRALEDAVAIDDETYETLRIESGIPKYGVDMDETTIVPELGLDGLISYNKGCYIGQEIIARIHFRGHVAKRLTGLALDGPRTPSSASVDSEASSISPQAAIADEGVRVPSVDELKALVAKDMGKPLAPSKIHFVSALPKTRNAKVMRRVIRAAYLGKDPGDLSALENPGAVEEIRKAEK